jgi:hypothetical protein
MPHCFEKHEKQLLLKTIEIARISTGEIVIPAAFGS